MRDVATVCAVVKSKSVSDSSKVTNEKKQHLEKDVM